MSYYAFFKGWLLLSQPPDCLCLPLRLPLNYIFGTLAGGLGSCPLDNGRYHPLTDCRTVLIGIRSLIGFGKLVGPLAHSVLYLRW